MSQSPWAAGKVLLLLAGLPLMGCLRLAAEAEVVDGLVQRMHSQDFAERQAATAELLGRDAVSVRHLVLPRLALESALTPLEVNSQDGNVVRGSVVGGDEHAVELRVTERILGGAVVSIPFSSIKVIRLLPPEGSR